MLNLSAIIGVIFIAVGIFNLITGRRRMVQAEIPAKQWYKQVTILTGIEYILLGLVLMINLGMTNNIFPKTYAGIIVAAYTLVLLLAAVVLGLMLYHGLIRPRLARRGREQTALVQGSVVEEEIAENKPTPQKMRLRREHRQKAAAARRRQSGRA